MVDGYWINFKNGKILPITEHMTWIRDYKNAKKLGVSEKVHNAASKIKDREAYLVFLMVNADLIRVRGHGSSVTFEYHSRQRQPVMEAIMDWGEENAGPFTWMVINNLATKETTQMNFEDFKTKMEDGGSEGVMRVANSTSKIAGVSREAMELINIAKEILNG